MKIILVPPIYNWSVDSKATDRWLCLTKINNILKEIEDQSELSIISDNSNLWEADWIIFMGWFAWSYKWYSKVLDEHLEDKVVYWLIEPPVVENKHNVEAVDKLLNRFKYILTWNEELQKLDRVFELNSLYNWQDDVDLSVFNSKKEKKLLTNISGNKNSSVKGELYSERKRVIEWFEKNHPDKFEFYGYGWYKNQYHTYFGNCEDKKAIYSKFKFALCLENISMKGYITEKIFDCFTAGIVPVYKGDNNIEDYIPKSCFVDYNLFKTVEEMYNFLNKMDNETYEEYIKNIKDFIINTKDVSLLSASNWVKCIEKFNKKNEEVAKFVVSDTERREFRKEKNCFIRRQIIGKIKTLIYNILTLLNVIKKQ